MTKRITISSLIFAMLLSFMPFGTFAQTSDIAIEPELVEHNYVVRPIIAPVNVQFIMDVKWGQVEGSVQQSNKVLFDGSISTNIGSVALMETMKFEQHDGYRDQITNRQNPVAWRSWVSNDWDGVKVRVDAPTDAKITIDTFQGAVILKVNQLAWTRDPFKLQLPDGREVVISTQPVPQTQHYMKVYWGAVKSTPDFPQMNFDLQESQAGDIQLNTAAEEIAPINVQIDPVLLSLDFSGILGVSGATLQSIRPYLFETAQGDRITYQDSSTVAWDSTIVNDIDGVWLRTLFENEKISNERFGIALLGDANLIKFYNMKDLFANKRTVETVLVYGQPYQLVIETFTIQAFELHDPIPPVVKPFSVTQPTANEVWRQGETHTIKWNVGDSANYMRYISLRVNDISMPINFDAVTLASGEFTWTIDLPVEILNYLVDKQVRIRVGAQPENSGFYADSAPFYIKKSKSVIGPIPLPINPPPKDINWPQLFDSEASAATEDEQADDEKISAEPEYISVSDPRRFEEEPTKIIEPKIEEPTTESEDVSDVPITHEETKPLYDPNTFSQPVTVPMFKEQLKNSKTEN